MTHLLSTLADPFATPRPAEPSQVAEPRPFDPRDHRCHCGQWGSRSPAHFADRPGLWFCAEHYAAGAAVLGLRP